MLLLPQDLRVGSGRALGAPWSDLVDALDLGAYAPYKGDGRRNSPYDPRMMVKGIYAYGTGTFSRKLAGKLEEDIAFRRRIFPHTGRCASFATAI